MTTAAFPEIYPQPRAGRGAGYEYASPGPIIAPRMRLFPFIISGTLNLRTSFSFPRLNGPAIVKEVTLSSGSGSDPPVSSLELGKAWIPISEVGVALTTPRPYSVLTELNDPSANMAGAAGKGWPNSTLPGSTDWKGGPLDLVVTDPEFYLVLALVNPSATAQRFVGQVRVLEGVDPDSLRFFL